MFSFLYYLIAEHWECSRFPLVEVWLFDVRVMGMRVFIRHGGLLMRSPAVKFPRKERPVVGGGAGYVLRTVLRQPRGVRRECRPEGGASSASARIRGRCLCEKDLQVAPWARSMRPESWPLWDTVC